MTKEELSYTGQWAQGTIEQERWAGQFRCTCCGWMTYPMVSAQTTCLRCESGDCRRGRAHYEPTVRRFGNWVNPRPPLPS